MSHFATWRTSACAVCAIGLMAVSVAQATPMSPGGALFVSASPVYQPGLWDTDTLLNSGSVKKASGVGNEFRINPNEVEFIWSGNTLSQDLSSQQGTSWLADAMFNSGGTMTLSGTIRSAVIPYSVLYTGTLLTANVSAFHLRETDKDSNILNSVDSTIKFLPTGGWLTTNSTVQLFGWYDFSIVGAQCGPLEGGSLNNFQAPLKSLTSFMINFNSVPEPASLVLLAVGLLWVRRR